MPGFDRTGPMGMGPRTGGGFGLCGPGPARATYGGYGRGAGRGLPPWGGGRGRAWGGGRGGGFWAGGWGGAFGGRGRALGRGWGGPGDVPYATARYQAGAYGWPWYAGGPQEDMAPGRELDFLRDQVSFLEQEMSAIQKRIKELEAK
jgi:hypothetical protein